MDTHVPEDATSFRDNLTVCIRYRVYGCSTRSVAELKIHSALANDRNYRIDISTIVARRPNIFCNH